MDRGSKVRIITFLVIFLISLGLFIFAEMLYQTEVKYVSEKSIGEETVLECTYNGDEENYSSKDVFEVRTDQKLELKKGDTMTIYHFGKPDGKKNHYEIKAFHVTKHISSK